VGEGAAGDLQPPPRRDREFFKFQIMRGRMHGDPTLAIEPAKKREHFRETFTEDQCAGDHRGQDELRDRIALRLLLHYGLRRGGLQAVQFKHFDHVRKRLTVFLKGGKVRTLPIPEPGVLARPRAPHPRRRGEPRPLPDDRPLAQPLRRSASPTKPMSAHGLHKWWYRCLANAGIVPEGTTSGERMHKARHTAGQTVLDKTGHLKAVQKLLGHESIQTTGDMVDRGYDRAGRWFDAVHASPPCQAYTKAQKLQGNAHPDLIEPVRTLLSVAGLPYVIENVPGAPLIDPVVLEGQMFDELRTIRPRHFETNWPLEVEFMRSPRPRQVKMGRRPANGEWIQVVGNFSDADAGRAAMGIDWMTRDELSEAIPPAYTEHIGRQLADYLAIKAAA
jgi:DNA (cytosine-5)-methyltransferase 1